MGFRITLNVMSISLRHDIVIAFSIAQVIYVKIDIFVDSAKGGFEAKRNPPDACVPFDASGRSWLRVSPPPEFPDPQGMKPDGQTGLTPSWCFLSDSPYDR